MGVLHAEPCNLRVILAALSDGGIDMPSIGR